jgi:hypothetical protein
MPRHHSLLQEGLTKADRLLEILLDRACHSTKELVRRIGHTFGGAIYQLRRPTARRKGYVIERRKHPTKKYQHQYRLRDD